MAELLEMRTPPVALPIYANLVNRSAIDGIAFCVNRNRQPVQAGRALDAVAIAPSMFVVLNVIVENENVASANQVEIAAPWDV
jgi:hypothetical protein